LLQNSSYVPESSLSPLARRLKPLSNHFDLPTRRLKLLSSRMNARARRPSLLSNRVYTRTRQAELLLDRVDLLTRRKTLRAAQKITFFHWNDDFIAAKQKQSAFSRAE
jgi:hypothetical protein